MKLKVCGMKYNPKEVAAIAPDYMGFIFYDKSPRNLVGVIPTITRKVSKVGVFVNASIEEILKKVSLHGLQMVQLHGQEPPELCERISNLNIKVIKVFGIADSFDFSVLKPYEDVCDYYLFDTKGKNPGGNGYTFDWEVLENYPSTKPYFLSGGIGLENIDEVLTFLYRPEAKYCYAIDVNSRFETKPGKKDIEKLIAFKKRIDDEVSRR
ncbi:phosphoribosylanthranilate isomerase [Croceivirga radicis]|uniref:N-(5'-phosphoribosyl)anthranilate isomerase n=1 Tax=Croceivirga radicis TaxID=1929488 RepID=A0A1V6LNB2_9FLAO|nr:phosphoribosylanthranilate isomerase [Croceivirga radicis]OQD41653.1 N-(5'-phosphoribosyl)anthranilate isomerase [Croceivirga radicis]